MYFHPTSLREVGWKHTFQRKKHSFQRKKDDVAVVFVEVLLFQHHLTTTTTGHKERAHIPGFVFGFKQSNLPLKI